MFVVVVVVGRTGRSSLRHTPVRDPGHRSPSQATDTPSGGSSSPASLPPQVPWIVGGVAQVGRVQVFGCVSYSFELVYSYRRGEGAKMSVFYRVFL